jgi:hypothetical protein
VQLQLLRSCSIHATPSLWATQRATCCADILMLLAMTIVAAERYGRKHLHVHWNPGRACTLKVVSTTYVSHIKRITICCRQTDARNHSCTLSATVQLHHKPKTKSQTRTRQVTSCTHIVRQAVPRAEHIHVNEASHGTSQRPAEAHTYTADADKQYVSAAQWLQLPEAAVGTPAWVLAAQMCPAAASLCVERTCRRQQH